jgi:2-polyprenyl-3-methyl-5-hydroxy-6-metoxy-1,4-benzoquinol methylase
MPPLQLSRLETIDAFLACWLSTPLLPDQEQQTLENYYRSYKKHFGPYVRHWYARQTQEVMEFIRDLGAPRLLEAGCGCGTESLWAALQGADVTAIDISAELLAVARARLSVTERDAGRKLRCAFLQMSVNELDETEPFDLIFLEQAFHHLEPRADVIAKLSRLVVPGGYVILSEGNGWNPLLQAVLFKKRGTQTVVHYQGHVWGNERITVPMVLLRQFRPYGLRPVRLRYFRVLPNTPIADQLRFLDRGLPQFLRPLFTHYNLVLRRDTQAGYRR